MENYEKSLADEADETSNSSHVYSPPQDFYEQLSTDIDSAGGPLKPDPRREGAIGATTFDLPNSKDDAIVVLLPKEHIQSAPSQALVRIRSLDDRSYLGIVAAGPFAEPDGIRGDSSMLVTVSVKGGIFMPPYHGRVQVEILSEEREGKLVPPRLRPLPNSPVFVLSEEETAAVLRTEGDIQLGLAFGHENIEVRIPSTLKSVLPRHLAALGTTGGGKSTTVARVTCEAQKAGMAVVLLDTEGEYTFLHEPTDDPNMLAALKTRNLEPAGLPEQAMSLLHLVGRETTNPGHPHRQAFSLQFARLSPYTISEILDLSEAQEERFLKAYDIAKAVLRDLGIFPKKGDSEQEQLALEYDEFERGYPRLTLSMMLDIVVLCMQKADKNNEEAPSPRSPEFQSKEAIQALNTRIASFNPPVNVISWRALLGRLGRLSRLKVFDTPDKVAKPLSYKSLLAPGKVSVIDLSDFGASVMSNLVITDLLQGIQAAQDEAYLAHERGKGEPPTPVLIIIEEAHEFLSTERIEKMPNLFEQVAKIAKRGRKRWLGLMFVTQLPQHLPRQVLALVNSYVLHKITDPQVVSSLQRTISGIDEGLWKRLSGLAPGQAIVAFPHMTRPLLITVDPAPCKLRMID